MKKLLMISLVLFCSGCTISVEHKAKVRVGAVNVTAYRVNVEQAATEHEFQMKTTR
jgi:hypothetical protein